MGNGIWRIFCLTTSVTAANTNRLYFFPATNAALLATLTGTVYIGGVQAQNALFASSHIPTTTATVPRNLDLLGYPYAGNIDNSFGSACAEFMGFWNTAPSTPAMVITVTDGNGQLLNTSSPTSIATYDAASSVAKSGLNSHTAASLKRAVTWGGSNRSITGDGLAPTTGAFDGTMGPGGGAFTIGCSVIGGNHLYGTTRNVKIWNRVLSDYELVLLTRK
jgi:hypothetical protein